MSDREIKVEIGGLDENGDELIKKKQSSSLNNTIPTKIYSLGGIEEIGKNCYCFEHDDEILVVDVGVKFINKKHFPGLSGVIPSMSYLKANQHKIKALIISHGHEDHIGGIVHVLKQVDFPVIYSPTIASELIKRKIGENSLPSQNVVLYSDNSVFTTKHFVIDFFRVNHSIPDCFGVCLTTVNGVTVFSGDFRFDFASKDDKFDLHKVGKISTRGVDLLLCESTNAETGGFNDSEKGVINELHNIMSSAKGRIIITFFASNIGRIAEIFKIAVNLNKKIVILGHSIDANISAAQHVGYLKFDEKNLISSKDAGSYKDDEILIICTGSQGEETSALSNISKNKHPNIKLKSSDIIIFSSNVIPGNTHSVEALINRLHKSGCTIYLNSPNLKIHSSGHATKLEQQLFISLLSPKYIVPVHGETRMLKALRRNAVEIGCNEDNIHIIKNGDVVHLLNKKAYVSDEKVDASLVYIDGEETTNSGEVISKERSELGSKGIIVVHLFLNTKKNEFYTVSPIANSGSYFTADTNFSKKIQSTVIQELKTLFKNKKGIEEIKESVANLVKKELYDMKKQKPHVEVIVTDSSMEEIMKNPIRPKSDVVPEQTKQSTT